MMTKESAEISSKLTKVFRDDSVFDASDEELNGYLRYLCSEGIPNESVRHRATNRCQVINTIKTFRLIDGLEKKNGIFTIIIIILSFFTLVLSGFSIYSTYKSSHETKQLIALHEKYLAKQNVQFEAQLKIQEKEYKEVIGFQKKFIESMVKK